MIDSAVCGRGGQGPKSPGSANLRCQNGMTDSMTKLMTLRGMLLAQNMPTALVDAQIADIMTQQSNIGTGTAP